MVPLSRHGGNCVEEVRVWVLGFDSHKMVRKYEYQFFAGRYCAEKNKFDQMVRATEISQGCTIPRTRLFSVSTDPPATNLLLVEYKISVYHGG